VISSLIFFEPKCSSTTDAQREVIGLFANQSFSALSSVTHAFAMLLTRAPS
jgi:septum formation inhibitor-activating ATPase MinD